MERKETVRWETVRCGSVIIIISISVISVITIIIIIISIIIIINVIIRRPRPSAESSTKHDHRMRLP